MAVPEDSKDDREPDGDRVNNDAETSEEQHEADRRQAVARRWRLGTVQHVEAQCERQVRGHCQSVGHGQSGQDAVGRRDHVATRQHDDVERVGDDAEDADDARQVAVILLIPVVEYGELASTRVQVLVASRRGCSLRCGLAVTNW